MGVDTLSPIAPARVRALLLPIGKIKRARFLSFVERLSPEHVVLLGDISPDARPNRNMFSPLAFPTGMIVYDLTTSLPPPSHLALSPFELHRQPLAIIAIADGKELDPEYTQMRQDHEHQGPDVQARQRYVRELDQGLEIVRDRYPKALVHQLLIFDYIHPSASANLPDGLIAVPPTSASKTTTIKTVMCEISSLLLAEMTTLAKSFQGMKTIQSPNSDKGARQANGYSWSTNSENRGNTQSPYPGSRGDSPTGKHDRSLVRMSLPVLRRGTSDTSRPDSTSRPTTPLDGSGPAAESSSPDNAALSRAAKSDSFRQHSRDRISVQGFGSGSSSELSRNKGQGRIGVTIGSLYLQAGRWADALRELVEGASIAKVNGDHLWHAKALELILVSMLMLAWGGHDFQIPQICYTSAEKSAYDTPPATLLERPSPNSSRLVSLQNLCGILPEYLSKVLNLYDRASNRAGESVPQLSFSENAARFSKLLTSVHLAGGKLHDEVLQHIVLGTPFSQPANVDLPRLNIYPTRAAIMAIVLRAHPMSASLDDISIIDRTIILGAIASVFGELGYHRKKAMIMRDLVSVLIPGLIQARVVGAAEMGIHPAAGLSSINAINGSKNGVGSLELGEGDVENGVDDLLGLIGRIYGVVTSKTTLSEAKSHTITDRSVDSDQAVVARIMCHAKLRAFGGQNIKMNVLRACINLAEALPDFQGALRFAADLLRTAGSGVAPGPRSEDASPAMARDEQLRLSIIIARTVSTGKTLGLHHLAAEYWDEFLVRGVDLETQIPSRIPIHHRATELGSRAAIRMPKENNPFIYNPFSRKPGAVTGGGLLVAGESATFKVTLQNPYEFDLEIESVRLEAAGADFNSLVQSTVIGPYRTQILAVSGTPNAAGSLTITGCVVKVRGCRERRFPIFSEPWAPQAEIKIKRTGLKAASGDALDVRLSSHSATEQAVPQSTEPKPTSLVLNVTEKQPVLVVKSCSLSQAAVMILEGERQIFSVTLQNLSNTTAADLLLFSFQDSTQASLQAALDNRNASPAELYEYELILFRKQAIRWVSRGDGPPYIPPGGTASFDFEILGKPGLTHAGVQVDYAYLGIPVSEVKEDFYTRQVSTTLTVTVNASVELVRLDVLPLSGDMPGKIWPGGLPASKSKSADDYCLVMMDMRNAWPNHLQVSLSVSEDSTIEDDILPGNTSRIIFPIRRIFLENPYAQITTLDPARQRQFVVSTDRISPDSERSTRETFWYREAILKFLSGKWKTISGPARYGVIEMRAIRLSPRMVEAIKVEPIGIELSIDGDTVHSEDKQTYHVRADEFLRLKARIINRTAHAVCPILRIQPSLRHHLYHHSLDLSKKLIWDGTLQRTIPIIPARDSTEVTFGLISLCRGQFEISASVEEAKLLEELETAVDHGEVGRPRGDSRAFLDTVLGARERRMWHSREPCVLDVDDAERDSDEDT
ncbi:MAG: hypothetical protein M1818_000027 [Claussenomyces sp. TS43310]|nr:MAG: hypothetical protein M1818_000027 [Claussenomyces sp. TS43310]